LHDALKTAVASDFVSAWWSEENKWCCQCPHRGKHKLFFLPMLWRTLWSAGLMVCTPVKHWNTALSNYSTDKRKP